MSKNDCISRSALYEKTAEWEAQALHMVELHLHDEDKAEWRKWCTVLAERSAFKLDVDDAPAVLHEMSAVEYDRERRRMCKQHGYCSVSCPLHDFDAGCMTYEPITQEAQNIVEKWAREHPEERSDKDE